LTWSFGIPDDPPLRAIVRRADRSLAYVYGSSLVAWDPVTGCETTTRIGRFTAAAFDRSGGELARATETELRIVALDTRGRVVSAVRFGLTPLRALLTLEGLADAEFWRVETSVLAAAGTVASLAAMSEDRFAEATDEAFASDSLDGERIRQLLAAAKMVALPERLGAPEPCDPIAPPARTLHGVKIFQEAGRRWIAPRSTPLSWLAASLHGDGFVTVDRSRERGDDVVTSELEEWVLAGQSARAYLVREPLTDVTFAVLHGDGAEDLADSLDRQLAASPPPPRQLPSSRVRRRFVEAGLSLAPLLRRSLAPAPGAAKRAALLHDLRTALLADGELSQVVAVYGALAVRSDELRSDIERVARSAESGDAGNAARKALGPGG